MPTFVHQPALGLAIIALPVLIHLINLLRHRRVQWAAMEFLLHSQRKNSTWVRLKELLLMLLRMAAIAAVVLALAEPLLHREIGFRLGSHRTHHVVLLDDSFSMADRWADTSAFERARQTVQRIGDDAGRCTARRKASRCCGSRPRSRPDAPASPTCWKKPSAPTSAAGCPRCSIACSLRSRPPALARHWRPPSIWSGLTTATIWCCT